MAFTSPSFCDNLRLLGSTPVPCGHFFWGLRLQLCCAHDGMPIGFELTPANTPEREAAKEMLEHVPLAGHVVIADKGFAGADFEGWMADRGAHLIRPDRKDEPYRHGSLGQVRQWFGSVFWTCKGQLGLERHGARTLPGLPARIALRLLALAAGIWHNHNTTQPAQSVRGFAQKRHELADLLDGLIAAGHVAETHARPLGAVAAGRRTMPPPAPCPEDVGPHYG